MFQLKIKTKRNYITNWTNPPAVLNQKLIFKAPLNKRTYPTKNIRLKILSIRFLQNIPYNRHIHRRNKKRQITKTKKSSYNNLTKKEIGALEELKRHGDIIITSADKSGTIVIQNFKQCIKEAKRQLNNIENYRPLQNNPTKINDTVNKTIIKLQKEHFIKGKVAEGLITKPKKTRFLYKAQNPQRRNPWKTTD